MKTSKFSPLKINPLYGTFLNAIHAHPAPLKVNCMLYKTFPKITCNVKVIYNGYSLAWPKAYLYILNSVTFDCGLVLL